MSILSGRSIGKRDFFPSFNLNISKEENFSVIWQNFVSQLTRNIFRWPAILYFMVSIIAFCIALQFLMKNWGGWGAGILIGVLIDMLTILLLGIIFAAVMHGVFQLIKTLLVHHIQKYDRGMK
ncbi:MAG: hypothetical protein LBQ54_16205 [Planctomycetaceae bacterium]|jgi:hypothetical protein|nr:hypothetical protein [Planctomycetaceae bacterium]